MRRKHKSFAAQISEAIKYNSCPGHVLVWRDWSPGAGGRGDGTDVCSCRRTEIFPCSLGHKLPFGSKEAGRSSEAAERAYEGVCWARKEAGRASKKAGKTSERIGRVSKADAAS